ncbi:MAG: hypothetical protein HRU13_09025 [Phycisphaerales bacterium]|nr:hypothetical protein [Phycisphaerales bacterium]
MLVKAEPKSCMRHTLLERSARVSRRVLGCCLFVVGVLLAAPPLHAAQDLTEAQLLEWFEAERQRAVDPEPLGNVRLDYEVHGHAYATAALLAQWKREVQGRPEHPRRRDIPIVERRLRDGPDLSFGSIWWPTADAWRQNIEPSRPTPGVVDYGDKGQQGYEHWRLLEGTVVREEPGSPSVRTEIRSRDHLIGLFFHGGMHLAGSQRVSDVRVSEDGWVIETEGESGWSSRFEGSWDAERSRGFIHRTEEYPPDDLPSLTFEFGPYELQPELARWCSTRIDYRRGRAPEQKRLEYVLAGVHRVDGERMAAVLRVPAIGREDAVRGLIAAGFEQDVGEGVVRTIDERGRVIATDRIAPAPPTSPALRIVGIVAAAAIVGVLVWMRVRG